MSNNNNGNGRSFWEIVGAIIVAVLILGFIG